MGQVFSKRARKQAKMPSDDDDQTTSDQGKTPPEHHATPNQAKTPYDQTTPNQGQTPDEPRTSSQTLPEGFKYIDNRIFSTKGNPVYALPNDVIEFDSLNAQHYQIRVMIQGNQLAPVHKELQKGIKVLDTGCGTGVWSIEMAHEYPNSDFVGTDLLDVFKDSIANAPPNVRFQVANTLKLPFEDNTFDYVFQRAQTLCFREDEWPNVIKELMRVTKPGGWVELIDSDAWPKNAGPQTAKFYTGAKISPCLMDLSPPGPPQVHQMMKMRDVYPKIILTLPDMAKSEGLEEIEHKQFSIPIGWGPPEIARLTAKNVEIGIVSFKAQMSIALAISDEDYATILREAPSEFAKYKSFWTLEVVYGRKPAGVVAE